MSDWFFPSDATLLPILLTALGVYVVLIMLTRLFGLRSFSKMSSFDFAMTVAIGSLVAGTLMTKNPPLLQGLIALAAVYVLQQSLAWLRVRSHAVQRLVDNEPLLLMVGHHYLEDNLRKARITEDDIRSKLRAANVRNFDQVRAVVFESTGDVNVIHGDGPPFEMEVFADVRDREELLDNDVEGLKANRRDRS